MKLAKSLLLPTLALAALGLAAGCGGDDDDDDNGGGGGDRGSCVQPEGPDTQLTYCSEPENGSEGFKTLCEFTGGTYSTGACDRSQYARGCRSTITESVNGGPEREVTYNNWYKAESKTTCPGDEITP